MTNQGAMGEKKNSFHLSKEAYSKLTANYNYSKPEFVNRKNQIAYATHDSRMPNS